MRHFSWAATALIVGFGATAAFTTAACGNGVTTERRAGGLTFKKTDAIAIASEELYVSLDTVRVTYIYQSKAKAPQRVTMAFPLPAVPVDDIFFCPHHRSEGCRCYKPALGMIEDAVERWDVDLASSFVVGDRWRDVDAGRAAGCYSILIERPYSKAT